jgi:predicted RNase H-like nuclease
MEQAQPEHCRREHGWMGGGRVLGVDACRAGWAGIALSGAEARAYFAPGIRELADRAAADGPLLVIAIDIPIGLADAGRRGADVLARRELRGRWPSLFIAPVRAAVEAADYQAAAAENRRLAGEGLSRQAFALQAKILDVDRWLRPGGRGPARVVEAHPGLSFAAQVGSPAPARVVEAHPELSFAAMAGAPLRSRKITWAGAVQRRTLLAQAGIVLDGDLGLARGAGWRRRRARRGRGGLDRPAGQPRFRALPAPVARVFQRRDPHSYLDLSAPGPGHRSGVLLGAAAQVLPQPGQ